MNIFDDIRLYLPKYLSEESTKELFKNLGGFPDNISNSLYSNKLWEDESIFQGDGLKDFLVINLPDEKIGKAPIIILSNTCDVELNNKRDFSAQICYAPVLNLEKYKQKLIETRVNNEKSVYPNTEIESIKQKHEKSVNQHIDSIKKQLITQILYLPIGGLLNYEGIVFLDRINHCNNKSITRENLSERRLFILSNYGFYLLLVKLSIHFTRLQEAVDRK